MDAASSPIAPMAPHKYPLVAPLSSAAPNSFSLQRNTVTSVPPKLSQRAVSDGEEKVASTESLDWSVLMRGKLYDREREKDLLLSCFSRIVSGDHEENELVLITGPSGNGKSALAKILKEHIITQTQDGCFVSGKFDQLQRPSESLGAFVQAFTQYARSVQAQGSTRLQRVRQDLNDALGPKEQTLLTQMIPALSAVFYEDQQQPQEEAPQQSKADMTGFEVQKRFQFVFSTFIRAISSPQHPIVLFLDDLQWAPKEAIDLLFAVSTDKSINGFMVLGAARGNEVSYQDELSVMLRKLEDNYELYITEIEVNYLSLSAIQQLLSDLFHLPTDNCLPLAKAVHSHTHGNPFFMLQFIRSLSEHGLIRVSTEEQLDVDYSNLDSLFVSTGAKDIVGLLCAKIQQLPLELQEVLQVAACFGAEFDRTVIDRVWQRTKDDCTVYLEMGQKEGFVAPARSSSDDSTSTTRYVFVHDKAQEAAYSMIEDKPAFHLMICRRVWVSYTRDELLSNAPLLVNQLCHGLDLIEKEAERISAAQLCAHAGKMAIESSSFPTAAFYFETGRKLLGRRPWRDSYDLALSLFSMSAEVEYAIGNLKTTDELVDEVLVNAQSLEDKIQAYKTRISNLGNHNRIEEAIEISMAILSELGEPIPRDAGTRHIVWAAMRAAMMLRGKSDVDLLNMKRMSDKRKSAAMNVLNASWSIVFAGSPTLTPLWGLKMMHITLRYGLCAISGVAFATYGFLLASMGNIEESVRFADLGMNVLKKFEGGHAWITRVNILAHTFCYSSKHAIRFSYQPLINGYRSGMVSGDTEQALNSLQFSNHFAVYSSSIPLKEVYRNMQMATELFVAYNQTATKAFHDVLFQMVANLLGHSPDQPSLLTGKHMTFDGMIRLADERGMPMLKFETYALNLVTAYIVGDLKVAERMHGLWKKEADEKVVMHMALRMTKLFQGLTLLALADACSSWSRRRRLLREAKEVVVRFRRESAVSPRNCLMKLHILEAEYKIVAHKKLDEGLKLFNSGIEHAKKEGAMMELGVACERAAIALRDHGRGRQAISYFEKALTHYEKWGAKVKVEQINAILESPFFVKISASATEG